MKANQYVTVRLSAEEKAAIAKIAARCKWTLSQTVRLMIVAALGNQGKPDARK
jgi:antitoxin component of RelBE/YafQ-DinJ toxin-antitoxin module